MIARALSVAAMLASAACAPSTQAWMFGDFDVERVAAMPPEGDAFQQALRGEYLAVAKFERDVDYDWGDTDFFLRRALAAGRAPTPPLELTERPIPDKARADLTAARARLAAALADGGGEAAPAEAAKAQAGYDCWVEQQEENYQPRYISACRKQYETAIAAVEQALKPPPLRSLVVLLPDEEGVVGRVDVRTSEGAQTLDGAREAARLDEAPARWRKPFEMDERTVDARFGRALAVPREVIRRYVLHFEENSAELTPDSRALMPEVIAVIANSPRRRASITGHADRYGSEGRNHAIAFQRALVVRDLLIAGGVASARVAPGEEGEDSPARKTPDGEKEPANRRVVIEFE